MAKNVNKRELTASQIKQKEYWEKRAISNYTSGEKDALEVAKHLKSVYKDSINKINDTINSFYGKYATETGLDLEEAKKLLNKNELKDFKSYIHKMISMGKKENFSDEEMFEFRRLYNKAKITRLEELQTNIRFELDRLTVDEIDAIENLLIDTYGEEYYKTMYDFQMDFKVDKAFSGLNTKAIQKAVNQQYLGSNYSTRLWENTGKILQNLLNKDIPRGLALGYNPRKLAKEIVSKRVNKTLYDNTLRLIRTEYSHILNQATIDSYKEADITQYQIVTTLDERRCEDCGEFEGIIVDIKNAIEGVDIPPFHPNCRCTTIPYFEEDYIDKMSKEELSNIGFVTYEDWKNGLVELKDGKVIYHWDKGLKKE